MTYAFPDGADIVVDCTGVPAVFPQAIECARNLAWDNIPTSGARVVVQGSYAEGFTVPYDAAFQREVQILVPRNYQKSDMESVIDLLAREKISLADMAMARSPIEAQSTYDELRTAKAGLLTAVFHWN